MPLINYACICGVVTKKYLRSAKEASKLIVCPKCGLEAKRVFGNVSAEHLITIDNGIMQKSITVRPDISEINDERSARDYANEED